MKGSTPVNPSDEFAYDPHDPAQPSAATHSYRVVAFLAPRDRRAVETRPDVLFYASDVLPENVEVNGLLVAKPFISTSARDTDFTVTLVDVHPDGRAIRIADGILRLRYCEGLHRQVLAQPGQVYEIDVDGCDQPGLPRRTPYSHRGLKLQLPALRSGSQITAALSRRPPSKILLWRSSACSRCGRPSHLTLPIVPA
jgi:hypothetical protein